MREVGLEGLGLPWTNSAPLPRLRLEGGQEEVEMAPTPTLGKARPWSLEHRPTSHLSHPPPQWTSLLAQLVSGIGLRAPWSGKRNFLLLSQAWVLSPHSPCRP